MFFFILKRKKHFFFSVVLCTRRHRLYLQLRPLTRVVECLLCHMFGFGHISNVHLALPRRQKVSTDAAAITARPPKEASTPFSVSRPDEVKFFFPLKDQKFEREIEKCNVCIKYEFVWLCVQRFKIKTNFTQVSIIISACISSCKK